MKPLTRRQLLAPVPLWAVAWHARAAEPLVNFNVMLLQPGRVLEARVPSVDVMAAYIKSVESAAREAVAAAAARQSLGGFIVVAVRPNQQSKVWIDFDALLDLEIRKQLIDSIQKVKPFEVRQGPVVFAMNVALWGGARTKRVAPAPPEWKAVKQEGPPLEIGQLVEAAWGE